MENKSSSISLKGGVTESQTITIHYNNPEEQRARINKLLSIIQFLGEVGSGLTIQLEIDGDGEDRMTFEGLDKTPINEDEIFESDGEPIEI